MTSSSPASFRTSSSAAANVAPASVSRPMFASRTWRHLCSKAARRTCAILYTTTSSAFGDGSQYSAAFACTLLTSAAKPAAPVSLYPSPSNRRWISPRSTGSLTSSVYLGTPSTGRAKGSDTSSWRSQPSTSKHAPRGTRAAASTPARCSRKWPSAASASSHRKPSDASSKSRWRRPLAATTECAPRAVSSFASRTTRPGSRPRTAAPTVPDSAAFWRFGGGSSLTGERWIWGTSLIGSPACICMTRVPCCST
mmetsp:Transcript_18604/g.52978  ORF Transcript_18604/g.52978 Transcript_18604/m.52978 type:complete len:253 (-) Transcript_18604:206-964(-)